MSNQTEALLASTPMQSRSALSSVQPCDTAEVIAPHDAGDPGEGPGTPGAPLSDLKSQRRHAKLLASLAGYTWSSAEPFRARRAASTERHDDRGVGGDVRGSRAW